ncbi:chromosome condensation complex Condensin, subunit G [Stygiomarasmius scandens]|uniref:Chromosome condensation complex Condensin, subunit G n=1 Tax=Marasmiellus scandens TaxID=2682957 RepID=A0ABR1JK61_9AGAR
MPARTVESRAGQRHRNAINPLDELPGNMHKIFEQAQTSLANHQKNIVALHKLFTEAAEYTNEDKDGNTTFAGEYTFEKEVKMALLAVCQEKKGNNPAKRIIGFVSGFVKYVNDKAAEEASEREDDDDMNLDTPATRFTENLVEFLLKGFNAKDKTARTRIIEMVSEVILNLGELDSDLYDQLRAGLIDRITDKEWNVRQQAATALCKLCQNESPDEVADGEQTLSQYLIDAMKHDTQPDVRQIIVQNLPIDGSFHRASLSHLLDRTRDVDKKTRKLVFARLHSNIRSGDGFGPTHPRKLTIAQRELIITNGLGDREPEVRAVAAGLITAWVDAIIEDDTIKKEEDSEGEEEEGEDKDKSQDKTQENRPSAQDGLVELLKMLDLGEGTVASDALLSVFTTDTAKTKFVENMDFKGNFWQTLTAEKAFLVRIFTEFCRGQKNDLALAATLEETLPAIKHFVLVIRAFFSQFKDEISATEEEYVFNEMDDEERERRADAKYNLECILGELLKIAVNLDYVDEFGRRDMYKLIRDEMLVNNFLPDKLAPLALDVLRELSEGERDFIRIVVEVIQEIRVPGDEDDGEQARQDPDASLEMDTPSVARTPRPKPREEMTEQERDRQDRLDMRCLCLCEGVLERVNGTFENNSSLHGVLTDLIIPCLARNDEEFRDKALICLSQICLISKRFAVGYKNRFVIELDKKDQTEALKLIVWRALIDMFMVYEKDVMRDNTSPEVLVKQFYNLTLDAEDTSDEMRTLLCTGMAKLTLSGILVDKEIIQCLVISYFAPRNAYNHALRQCLAYFLPAYCYSSTANQRMMKEVFRPALRILSSCRDDSDEEDMAMASPSKIVNMLVEWMDPNEVIDGKGEKGVGDMSMHVDLAIEIMCALLEKKSELGKDDTKALCQGLGRIFLPDEVDDYKIRSLAVSMDNVTRRRPLRDAVSKNAFTKFKLAVEKKYEKQLEGFSEEEYRKLEEYHDFFKVIDQLLPPGEDEDEDTPPPQPKRTRKRRSESVVSTATEGDDAPRASSSRKRGSAKRRRLTASDDEPSDFEGDDRSTERATSEAPSVVAAPTRIMPKRGATRKPAPEPIVITSESEEDQEATPRVRNYHGRSSRPRAPVKEEEDEEDEQPTPSAARVREESIVPDSEEEEDEVNDLLAGDTENEDI